MIGSILIPLDTSPYSEKGLKLGSELAAKLNTKLFGLAIVDEPTITEPQAKPLGASGFSGSAKEAVLKEAFDSAETLKSMFEKTNAGKKVSGEFIRRSGNPAEEILSESIQHDLLILGKKTYFKYATQREECETFETLTKNSPRPFVLIDDEFETINFKEAVISTDGSHLSLKSIQMFVLTGLAQLYDKLTVISTSQDLPVAEKNVNTVLEYLKKHKLQAVGKPIKISDTAWEPVISYCKEYSIPMLVMGVYGTGGFKEFFMGSFTSSILEKSQTPIFTSK